MPYPTILPGFGLAKTRWLLAGANHDPFVIFGYKIGTAVDAFTSAADVGNAWTTHVMPDLSSSLTLDAVFTVENRGGVLSEGNAVGLAVVGGTGGQPVPPNTSLLVPKQTGLIGKHFRGRMYVPGLPASAADAAQANVRATPLAAYQTDFADFLTALTGGGINGMYLLHRNASTPTLVSGLGVEALLATQSRRLRKVAHR